MKLVLSALLATAIIAHTSASPLSIAGIDAVTAATVNNKCNFNLPIATTTTTAVITWTNNRTDGTATISWGVNLSNMQSRAVTTSERSARSITLTGLLSNTWYNVRLEISKTGETSQAAVGTFQTKSGTIALTAQIVLPVAITDSTALISWTESAASDSVVCLWGTTNPPTTVRRLSSTEHQAKAFTLAGLNAATKYNVALRVYKANYTPDTATTSFTTKNQTLALTAQIVLPVAVTDSTALINWTESAASDSVVCLWGTNDPPTTVRRLSSTERQAKAFTLAGLNAATKYNVALRVYKANYTPDTAATSFTTKTQTLALTAQIVLPVVSTDSMALISWTESAASDSVVCLWGTNDPPTTVRRLSSTERQAKAFTLAGLKAATKYNIALRVYKANYTPDTATTSFTTKTQTLALTAQIVLPVVSTDSTALISWTESAASDSVVCLWGTTNPPTTVRKASRTERQAKSITLHGLTAATQYNVILLVYKINYLPDSAATTFTTGEQVTAAYALTNAAFEPVSVAGNRLLFGNTVHPGDRIAILDMRGRTLRSHMVNAAERSLSLDGLRPAAAVLSISRGATLIMRRALVIGH